MDEYSLSKSVGKSGLELLIDQSHLKVAGFLKLLGFSRPTWYRRMEDPDTFTIAEIKKLATTLNRTRREDQPQVTAYDIINIIMAAKTVGSTGDEIKVP